MRSPNWTRILLGIGGIALLCGIAASMLPDNPYQRFSTLENTIQARIRWIYERINYDPAPIDVAVLGSSRWGAAIDSSRLQADLARLGRPLTTVNFALPENGRDLHWVILQELLRKKHPRLLVIGVIEKPSRLGHPAYKYVAPTREVVDPAYPGNLNYLSNLVYLPYRQLRLFGASLSPAAFGLPSGPDLAHYTGSNNENAFAFHTDDGKLIDRDRPVDRAVLAAQVRRYEEGVHPPFLDHRLAGIEFGDERAYTARMASAARSRGIPVVFMFLPYYTGPHSVQERAFYERFGPIIDASFLSTHDELYADVAHLNRHGGAVLTDWLAPRLAAYLDRTVPPAIAVAQDVSGRQAKAANLGR